MKLLRKKFTPVHNWAGLLAGWLLFVIFFAGSLSVFRPELDIWFRPEIPSAQPLETTQLIDDSLYYLNHQQPNAEQWFIYLPQARTPHLAVAWLDNDGFHERYLHNGKAISARDTEGGLFFTEFHHELHYFPREWALLPYAIITLLSCIALVSLISGVIIHRKIFADFFSFSKNKGQRSWLNAHTLFGVIPLPFYLMIIYSGAVILGLHGIMTSGQERVFPDNQTFWQQQLASYHSAENFPTEPMALPDIHPYIQRFLVEHHQISIMSISQPNTTNAELQIASQDEHDIARDREFMRFQLATGELIKQTEQPTAWLYAMRGIIGLHLAFFTSYPLLWLYFLFGLSGCVMIATGAILWERKREKGNISTRGLWWVKRLNLATFAGFPLACISYLYANRLLPFSLENRAEWEIDLLFFVWAATAFYAFLPQVNELKHKWCRCLQIMAVALWGIPLLDIAVGRGFWQGDAIYLSIEGIALIFGAILWKISKRIY